MGRRNVERISKPGDETEGKTASEHALRPPREPPGPETRASRAVNQPRRQNVSSSHGPGETQDFRRPSRPEDFFPGGRISPGHGPSSFLVGRRRCGDLGFLLHPLDVGAAVLEPFESAGCGIRRRVPLLVEGARGFQGPTRRRARHLSIPFERPDRADEISRFPGCRADRLVSSVFFCRLLSPIAGTSKTPSDRRGAARVLEISNAGSRSI